MRSKQALVILTVLIILSTTALAQTVKFSLSLQETKTQTLNKGLNPQTPTTTYNLPANYLLKQAKITTSLGPCMYTTYGGEMAYGYNCGSIQICIKTSPANPTCKQLNAQGGQQTTTFDLNEVSTYIQVSTSGTWNSDGYNYITINKIEYTGGASSQHSKTLFSLKGNDPINLGVTSQLIAIPEQYTGPVNVVTDNQKAIAWFEAGDSDTTRKTTSIYTDPLMACLNSDAPGNTQCDYEDERECAAYPKYSDWFAGDCCGDAPYNPTTDQPPNECKWYSDKAAVCYKPTTTSWKWTALEEKGIITTLGGACPAAQLVSDGGQFYTCSTQAPNIPGLPNLGKITSTLTIEGHEYKCEGENIIECGGNTPYSTGAKTTGETITINNQKQYCGSDGKWKTSLDTDKDACQIAGHTWTGAKCCGEPDDTIKTYEDTYTGAGTAGSCFNNQFIASGQYLGTGKQTINYRGKYYICAPPGISTTEAQTQFQGTGITPTTSGVCGTPLQGAKLTGTLTNIICTPSGDWIFTSSTDLHLMKETKWQPPEGDKPQGCCPDNQCWDGKTCKNIAEYYTIEERGFRCE